MTQAMSNLTSEQRAAVVLVSLEPEQAKPLAELLGDQAMRRIRMALTKMPHISDADVLSSFAEFITQLAHWQSGLRGGEKEAAALLTHRRWAMRWSRKFADPWPKRRPTPGMNSDSWSPKLLPNMSADSTQRSRRL